MTDVSAVVLTIGEPYTERALDSIRRQTAPLAETIVVEGVSPFYRAMNAAVARVRTDFFIQVDADMILDPTCVASLRARMSDRIGIVLGLVRDPLRGRIPAVKLYRTRCFADGGFRDSICQDTDFAAAAAARGWFRLYALRRDGDDADAWHTFAAHEPDYSPLYTFYKFVTEGARSRRRPHERRALALLRQMRRRDHPAAAVAAIGIACGLFLDQAHDRLAPSVRTEEFDRLDRLLRRAAVAAEPPPASDLIAADLAETFRRAHARGARLGEDAAAAFFADVEHLRRRDDLAAAVALIGLCRGVFQAGRRDDDAERDFAELRALLLAAAPAAQGSSAAVIGA